MKKSLIVITTSLLMSFGAHAATEGVEYQVLPKAIQFDAPNQVVKIYSINCPFCYKYEKAGIPNVKIIPAGMSFEQYHITTKPPFGIEKSTALAIAKVVKGDSVFKELKNKYYEQYHVKKEKFKDSDSAIAYSLDILSMSRAEFDSHAKDPAVKALLAKWDLGVEVAKIQGIPAITVNGKYLINTKSISSMEVLKELIAELSDK
ncbi:thiol:disulfide interchange protein DsbA/DsbL [Shewanella oneidensis MR-1]|uniref:Thiol:disulfide interchange protein n=1 Tax=Shewanella oneidensis (strain ATCC 700550 / JCM 31522 / CIP 106686 / LMG 19005 / NCIMB 14063 / MR-1) TaxID=211586 RepID=Q8EAM7_SHEON|nr:thiol:disulfide interchange protein DsbA/DsbL [Shewanella oneidensis]AAN56847.1 thiol:disulfide interchange protein DsbA family [Shewanella oneidensis MR-1]MDX5998789.1 thiol:disulfide interchange protein DsbA/DsbL [Shewanella oneidensis]MEE2029826.1 Thiol:disulfide interchange protein DsbL [Shewanella oneidensis]QKG98172.1 thiol:disulfide interchange protein DsbA/DsbL [Shewanella oneidensis MR-1]